MIKAANLIYVISYLAVGGWEQSLLGLGFRLAPMI